MFVAGNTFSGNGTRGEGSHEPVRAFIVETFLLGEDDGFANDESLIEAGILDSTGVMELVAFLEERFKIAVADDELVAANLDSVDNLAAFVGRKVKGSAGAEEAAGAVG